MAIVFLIVLRLVLRMHPGSVMRSRGEAIPSRSKRRRRRDLSVAIATISILPMTVCVLWLSGWYANGRPVHAADALVVGETLGKVWKIEPAAEIVHVSSAPLGIGALSFEVTTDTRFQVGTKEGALGDLREGMRVRVVYERRHAARVASSIEVLGARDTDTPAVPLEPDRASRAD